MNNFKKWFVVNEAISTMVAGSPEHAAIMQKLDMIDTRVKTLDQFIRELEDNLAMAVDDIKQAAETKKPQTPLPLKIMGTDWKKKSA